MKAHSRSLSISGAVLWVLLACAFSLHAQKATNLERAGNRLCDLQADTIGDNAHNGLIDPDPDDGGWDWDIAPSVTEHSPDPSPSNTYGVTALGLLTYFEEITPPHNARFVTAIWDTYLGIAANTNCDKAPDIVFLTKMSIDDPTHNPGYAAEARIRYDARVAAHGGPHGLAQYLADTRGAAGQDGLVPWELCWMAEAALALDAFYPGLNYDEDAKLYGHAIADDIYSPTGYFQIDKPSEMYYTLGLASTARAMRLTRVDNPLRNDAYTRLVGMQKVNGSFPWSGNDRRASYQTTAYALSALNAIQAFPPAAAPAQSAAAWLLSKQLPSGGWEYEANHECTEVDGEIMAALSVIMLSKNAPLTGSDVGEDTCEAVLVPEEYHVNASLLR